MAAIDRQCWGGEAREDQAQQRLDMVERLATYTQQLDLFGLEFSPVEIVAGQVLPAMRQLVERAHRMFSALDIGEDGGVDTGTSRSDITFFTLREIGRMRRLLDTLESGLPSWKLVELCDRFRGTIITACTALHRSFRAEAGLDREDAVHRLELQQGLEVRARYTAFREELAAVADKTEDDLEARMRLATRSVAMLVGSAEYRVVRVGDRVLLADLQGSLLAWLATGEQDVRSGERLWSDLMAFVELSRGIDKRAELQEYDRQRAAERLQARPAPASFPTMSAAMMGVLYQVA